MLGRRIRTSAAAKAESQVESPQNIAASDLIGGSGVSLDGQSLVLPEQGIEGDDISSINTSNYGGGVKTELRILGTVDPYDEDVPPPVTTPHEGLGAPTREQIRRQQQRQRMQHYNYERKAYPAGGDLGDDKDAKSFDKGDGEDDEGCLPLWLTEAPTWLKLVIVLSTALLVGAIVLIGVGAALSVQEEPSPANGNGQPSVPIGSPTAPPVIVDPTSPNKPEKPVSSPTVPSGGGGPPPTPKNPVNPGTPTQAPTAMPTSNTVSLFVTAGRFTGDARDKLPDQLPTLPNVDGATVMVHLGDWNSPFATSCSELSYQENAELYSKSNVPVYFVPGDNEYNDCPDPEQAFGLWYQYVLEFETKYWAPPTHWNITRQLPDYPENFAYVYNGVLFVGINLVGGVIHDAREWENRHAANLQWIDDLYAEYHPQGIINTMVIFAHADPDIQANDNFFQTFLQRVESDYQLMTIFVHRNLGIESWGLEAQYNRIQNLIMVVVEGSIWPPMLIEIDPAAGVVDVDQTEWYSNYINGTST